MRKTIFALLIAVSLPAFAEWKLTEILADGSHLYYDPSTIERKGNLARVWELSDLRALNQVGRLSYRDLNEYDCSAHRHRNIRSESYLTHLATGAPVDVDDKSSGDAEWYEYYPGSRAEKMGKVVCAK
jgi:hypothetical protein